MLIHGVGSTRQTWSAVVDELSPTFTCVTYDLRGHGESSAAGSAMSLEALVGDLEELRETLGLDAAHVFGHSLGAMIAAAYARAYPQRTLSMGLLSTAAYRTEEEKARVQGIAANIRAQGAEKLSHTFPARWYTDAFVKNHPDVVEAKIREVINTNPEVFANAFSLYSQTEMGPWLPEILAPGLVLTGELDVTCTPQINQRMAVALRRSKLVILGGLKHGLILEAPGRVAREIADFLLAL